MTDIPSDQHITYQLQYRKCGKTSCSTCRNGQGHGPYWYAYWREGSRLRSGYIGKVHPHLHKQAALSPEMKDTTSTNVMTEGYTEKTASAALMSHC
jgi:hypothetical protein